MVSSSARRVAYARTLHSGLALPRIRGVVFDLDGTMNIPDYTMFTRMRGILGISDKQDILKHIDGLEGPDKVAANEAIESIERSVIDTMSLQPGLLDLLNWLDRHSVPKAILTRNNQEPVLHFVNQLLPVANYKGAFDPVITRKFKPTKPSPAPLLHIAKQWNMHPQEILMVGDGKDDMKCGREAGSVTCFMENKGQESAALECEKNGWVDLKIQRISQIKDILEGFDVYRED
ncbi:hypothetical protein BZG36_00652 [Bifiguratus adelaidae]|uniref:Uncharacterized protein n=1 Tax=Bifiguratus adelaidae TaxID=1938954 RepID=A0A261Y6V6_9FUNG|nr:hypothetical protein BZG36_00652 [Bifiguratus adelaidae]